jgi:hypothetical protein
MCNEARVFLLEGDGALDEVLFGLEGRSGYV